MNKKVLLVFLLMFPMIVFASCNQNKYEEYKKLASQITYDNKYDQNSSTFTVTVYNITSDMYVLSGKTKYRSDNNDTVVFSKVKEGGSLSLFVYGDEDCPSLKFIGIVEPYYNKYYKSSLCVGYENLPQCSKEFTSSKVTREILDTAKYYADKNYEEEARRQEKEVPKTVVDVVKELIQKWWVKVLLVVLTTIISISVGSSRLRKIKHGI